ncbi:MAG: type I pullulanase, partial [Bacteroidota bacterium]
KFLGLVEPGTKSPDGLATGLDHFKELGITHVHLLPSYDFMPRSVDESQADAQYNWGYDPQNYNVPEGAYSSNPYDGAVRIKEFKEMVQTFHENGIRVILDVVYNHTGMTEASNFNQLAPGYYYRFNEDGSFSNASGCGNETASERPMMRKFMLESMKYWVEEYHLDGFRVDLMAIHDIETMNQIARELQTIDPSIFVYGEGWTAGDSPLPVEQRSLKANAPQLQGVAVFSDDVRDGLKGSVFDEKDRGFASAKPGMKASIQFGIVAATQHPQVDYDKVNYSNSPWANSPRQCINYVSCHDNHTLYDKLILSTKELENPAISEAEIFKMHRLANTIVLTSQGIPFLHAGVDLARTKDGVENSYKSPDAINQIDWTRKQQYFDHFQYYRSLIGLRKKHPAFRMNDTEEVQQHLKFLDTQQDLVLAYEISGNANGDEWERILVVFNGNRKAIQTDIPKADWTIVLKEGQIDENGLGKHPGGSIGIEASSAMVLFL